MRYLVILTIQTTEVTTRTSNRQTLCSRMEMVQGLLFDGLDGQRTGFTVHLAKELAIVIPAATTKARLTIGNLAMVWTE